MAGNLSVILLFQIKTDMQSNANLERHFWISPDIEVVAVAPEILVPRLGDRLVEKGLLSPRELEEALRYQKARAVANEPILIGETLIELGMIERIKLNETITEQISHLQEDLFRSKELLELRVSERTAELQEAFDKITELNRLKANFVGNMSHELRTPLAHLVGYTELLDDESLGPLTAEQHKAVDVLKKSHRRLGSLIDNLLFVSFDRNETLPLELKTIPLNDFIDKVLQHAQKKAEANNLQLISEVPENLPSATIDTEKMHWAISQLTDNAVKFNQPKGEVLIKLEDHGTKISLGVEDTGIGIPEDKLQEIFEPFYQIDSSSTRKYGGAGLGLSLAKRIIESHGAELQVQSTVGEGTRFAFQLPVTRNSHEEN